MTPPLTPIAEFSRPPAWTRWTAWGVIALGWILLFVDTLPIREANLDDLGYHRMAVQGRRWEGMQEFNRTQGRYYGYIAYLPFWIQDTLVTPWVYQVFRLGLVAASLWGIGRLAGRISGSDQLPLLWGIMWIATLQIPPTFYGLLSYPAFNCAFFLVFAALNRFWTRLQEPGQRSVPWESGLLLFAALHFSETFLVFVAAFALLWWWQTDPSLRKQDFRMLYPVIAASALYFGLYLGYRQMNPPSYEGTVAGYDLRKMAVYLFRYSAASLPGFEIVVDRDVQHGAFHAWPEIMARLETINWWRTPWAAVAGGAVTWLLVRSDWRPSRRVVAGLTGATFLMGLLYLGLPALSAKYQEFAYRRFYPHVYNFGFVHLCWLAVAITALGLAGTFPAPSAQRRLIAASAGALVAISCLAAQISNPLAIEEIRRIISGAHTLLHV